MTLDEVGCKNQTDKGSLAHHYLDLYERLFPQRHETFRLLEIGVQFGNSLRTWHDYYPFATIVGIDTIDSGFRPYGRISTIYGEDAYTDEIVFKLTSPFGLNGFDVIIDDGDHALEHQAFVVASYHRLSTPTGLLVIEDVQDIKPLKAALPNGFNSSSVEMTEGASLVDSRLFIAWRS